MAEFNCTVYITTKAGDEYVLDGWVPENYGQPYAKRLSFLRVEDVNDRASTFGWAYDLSQITKMNFLYNEEAGYIPEADFIEEEPSIWVKKA